MLPRTPQTLADDLAGWLLTLPDRARVLVDGVGGGELADAVVPRLAGQGRPVVRVSGGDFQRPAGERFAHGRQDPEHFRDGWTDTGALQREVLASGRTYLPSLRDRVSDRSSRAERLQVPERGVVVVDGIFLLGLGLQADLVVHLAVSPAGLARRGVPDWQLPAFASYDALVRPGELADVLVRAEDPLRPAVLRR